MGHQGGQYSTDTLPVFSAGCRRELMGGESQSCIFIALVGLSGHSWIADSDMRGESQSCIFIAGLDFQDTAGLQIQI